MDYESQQRITTVLTSISAKARTVICEQAPKPAVKARLSGFFNGVVRVQRALGSEMPVRPQVMADELATLSNQCTGPLSPFRARIAEAKEILESAA